MSIIFYRTKEAKKVKGFKMPQRGRNFLFSSWKKRQVNMIKGKREKRERKFASYCAHYFAINGIFGFYAHFFINSVTIIVNLLFVTIFIYILILLNTTMNSYIAYVNNNKKSLNYLNIRILEESIAHETSFIRLP